MINFQRLNYFCIMVEEGGIHRAARRLKLSQPPLSLALKELEKELGCELVYRGGRNWVVTDAGRRLYEEGRAILAQTGSIAARLSPKSDEIQGEVRAGFSTSCVSMFNHVLPRMAKDFPLVTCSAMFTDSSRLAANVCQRLIDFAVLYLPVDGSDKDFVIVPLRPQRLIALFSRLLEPPEEGEMSMSMICRYPLLMPRRWNGGGIYSIFAKVAQSLGLSPNVICQTQSTYLLRDMLDSIAAVAILPRCETGRQNGCSLPVREVAELDAPLVPALVTLSRTYIPMPARQMMSLLLEEYGT